MTPCGALVVNDDLFEKTNRTRFMKFLDLSFSRLLALAGLMALPSFVSADENRVSENRKTGSGSKNRILPLTISTSSES
jgi:hypothetical protein